MPTGSASPEAVVLAPTDVKSGCPMTVVASIPLLNGGANPITRELPSSATYNHPFPSKATPRGLLRLLCGLLFTVVVKSGNPSIRSAAWPLEKGGLNFKTLQFSPSETHTFPAESIPIPHG